MKRFVWLGLLLALVALTTTADSFTINENPNSPKLKQIRIEAGDATNPQTFSVATLFGKYADSWSVVSVGGNATMKVHGLGGTWPYFWRRCWSNIPANVGPGTAPLDSFIVLRDATTSAFSVDVVIKP